MIVASNFQRAVDLWTSYYAKSESAARTVRHLPADDGENFVRPLRASGAVAQMLVDVSREIADLGFDPAASRVAREEASWAHEEDLKPCECASCRGYRR